MKNLFTEISSTLPAQPLRRFFRLVGGEKKSIFHIYFYAILVGAIGLSLPLGIQAIINVVSTGVITTSWFVLIVVVTGGILLSGLLQILQLALMESIQQRIFVKSALELSIRIPRLDSEKLRNHYVPELVNRFFDTVTVQKGLSKILLDFSTASLQIIFGLILLSFYHPFFIIFGVILLLILIVIIRITGAVGLKTSLAESKHKYEVAHWLEEIGRHKELFKGPIAGAMSARKTDELTLDYLGARKSHFRILVSKYSLLLLFKLIIIAGLLIIGSWLVVENQLNLGQFVAAEIIIILIISSIEKLIYSVETIYDVLTGLEKIGYLTDLPLESFPEEEIPDPNRNLAIELENFTLEFPDTQGIGLSNINLSVQPGEKIWINGGDTRTRKTLIRSISGDFQNFTGKLSIGGIPIRNWDRNVLRSQLGIYSNGHDIIDATLLENICLLSGPLPLSKVNEVAEAMGLNEYIGELPEGWNTIAGPEGLHLPEDIKAKIALGRLLLENPKVYLLSGLFTTVQKETSLLFWELLKQRSPEAMVLVLDSGPSHFPICDKVFHFQGTTLVTPSTVISN